MMNVHQRIEDFKNAYFPVLTRWPEHFDESHLVQLIDTAMRMQSESEDITQMLERNAPVTFEKEWRPVLEEAKMHVDRLLHYLGKFHQETGAKLESLQLGQKVLLGYRQRQSGSTYLEVDG